MCSSWEWNFGTQGYINLTLRYTANLYNWLYRFIHTHSTVCVSKPLPVPRITKFTSPCQFDDILFCISLYLKLTNFPHLDICPFFPPKNRRIGQWGFLLLYCITENKQVLGRVKKPTFKSNCILTWQINKWGQTFIIIKFLFFKEEEVSWKEQTGSQIVLEKQLC